MHPTGLIKILLVEDDEDDYIMARDLLSEIPGHRFTLDWAKTYAEGLEDHGAATSTMWCWWITGSGPQNGVELCCARLWRRVPGADHSADRRGPARR